MINALIFKNSLAHISAAISGTLAKFQKYFQIHCSFYWYFRYFSIAQAHFKQKCHFGILIFQHLKRKNAKKQPRKILGFLCRKWSFNASITIAIKFLLLIPLIFMFLLQIRDATLDNRVVNSYFSTLSNFVAPKYATDTFYYISAIHYSRVDCVVIFPNFCRK